MKVEIAVLYLAVAIVIFLERAAGENDDAGIAFTRGLLWLPYLVVIAISTVIDDIRSL